MGLLACWYICYSIDRKSRFDLTSLIRVLRFLKSKTSVGLMIPSLGWDSELVGGNSPVLQKEILIPRLKLELEYKEAYDGCHLI